MVSDSKVEMQNVSRAIDRFVFHSNPLKTAGVIQAERNSVRPKVVTDGGQHFHWMASSSETKHANEPDCLCMAFSPIQTSVIRKWTKIDRQTHHFPGKMPKIMGKGVKRRWNDFTWLTWLIDLNATRVWADPLLIGAEQAVRSTRIQLVTRLALEHNLHEQVERFHSRTSPS